MEKNVNRPTWWVGVLTLVALVAIGWGLAQRDEPAPVEKPPAARSIRQVLNDNLEVRRRVQITFAR